MNNTDSSMNTMFIVVFLVVIVALGIWFIGGMRGGENGGGNIDVNLPAPSSPSNSQ